MLSTGYDFPVENYKSYKNRTNAKHIDKIKNQLRQITDCSLAEGDKVKLKKQLIELVNESIK